MYSKTLSLDSASVNIGATTFSLKDYLICQIFKKGMNTTVSFTAPTEDARIRSVSTLAMVRNVTLAKLSWRQPTNSSGVG